MTRPDIAFTQSHFSKFGKAPTTDHMSALKRFLNYIAGTKEASLLYPKRMTHKFMTLWGQSDSDWKGCSETGRSTGGYLIMLNNSIIAWAS